MGRRAVGLKTQGQPVGSCTYSLPGMPVATEAVALPSPAPSLHAWHHTRSTGAGVVYPAYQSFKAIEDKRDPTLNEQWLTYWAMWGLLSLAESTTDDILSKLPYYYHAKFALLLWLQMPSTQVRVARA